MSKQILVLDVVNAASCEMDVPKEVIFEAIEAALEMVTKKRYLNDIDVKVSIDRKAGKYDTFRRWTIVDENDEDIQFDPSIHITLQEAKSQDPSRKIGDVVEEPIKSVEFGRIAAQIAKQVIIQKVREAKRARVVDTYREKLGQLITGIVKRTSKEGVILDLGDNAEVFIQREDVLPGEIVHIGDRLRAYLYDIRPDSKGPQLYASRTKKEMLRELFYVEVPEIGEEVIEIKALARDPGNRSKIAVKTKDGRIDPIGACVGMRGSRVQAISNELNGERIDIVLWDDNPAQLVINALSPAEIASIVMDEETKTMDVAVEESQLSQAIGRSGQNIRLASGLSGWKLNIMSTEEAKQKSKSELEQMKQKFTKDLDVDDDIAEILVREGFTSLEEIAYVPVQELVNIEEFDEEIVKELRKRANSILEKEKDQIKPSDDLLSMQGMEQDLAYRFAEKGIRTMEDLAEQSVDELLEVADITEEEAKKLIMTAREPWFK